MSRVLVSAHCDGSVQLRYTIRLSQLVYQGASIGDLAKALNPTPGDPSGIDQNKYETLGNDWLRANYNNVSWINDISFM